MGVTATVGSAGFVAGPFAVRRGRPFGAWFELYSLGGADSLGVTTDMSEDGLQWNSDDVFPALTVGTRGSVYIEVPKRYARLVFAATAPGGWTGSALVAYDASREEWDLAIESAVAAEEQARFDAAVADVRTRLGIDAMQFPARTPGGLFAGR